MLLKVRNWSEAAAANAPGTIFVYPTVIAGNLTREKGLRDYAVSRCELATMFESWALCATKELKATADPSPRRCKKPHLPRSG